MISPLVLVHPSEENVEELDKCLLFKRESLSIVLEFFDDIVGKVDDIRGPLRLPEGLIVFALDREVEVVQEASEYFFFLP
jgi:hypothetical protein